MSRKRNLKKHRKNPNGPRASRNFSLEPLEHRIVLTAPQFVSVQPNGGEVLTSFDILNSSPRELTIRFDQDISGSDASLNGIKVLRDGVEIDAVSRELGLLGNTVVLRFSDALPDDIYSIQVTEELRNVSGEAFEPGSAANQALPLNFELDLGTKVSAVVPQPITPNGEVLSHALDQIEIYFNDDELSPTLANSTDYYQLILTQDTVSNTDDEFFSPISAVYSQAEAKVTLTFADDLHNLADGDGTFRLRVGTNEPTPSSMPLVPMTPGSDPADSFDAAFDLPALSGTSQIVSSSIDAQPFPLSFPGSRRTRPIWFFREFQFR